MEGYVLRPWLESREEARFSALWYRAGALREAIEGPADPRTDELAAVEAEMERMRDWNRRNV